MAESNLALSRSLLDSQQKPSADFQERPAMVIFTSSPDFEAPPAIVPSPASLESQERSSPESQERLSLDASARPSLLLSGMKPESEAPPEVFVHPSLTRPAVSLSSPPLEASSRLAVALSSRSLETASRPSALIPSSPEISTRRALTITPSSSEASAAFDAFELDPARLSRGRRFSKSNIGENRRYLCAFLNGSLTLTSVDGRSMWELNIGSPLWHSKQMFLNDNGEDYFIFQGEDWNLYEYRKDRGIKKLSLTVEDLVNNSPQKKWPVATFGRKITTLYKVDSDSGHILSHNHELGPRLFLVSPHVKQRRIPNLSTDRSVISIVITSYMLKSSVNHNSQWSISGTHIAAHISPTLTERYMFSDSYQVNVPVLFRGDKTNFSRDGFHLTSYCPDFHSHEKRITPRMSTSWVPVPLPLIGIVFFCGMVYILVLVLRKLKLRNNAMSVNKRSDAVVKRKRKTQKASQGRSSSFETVNTNEKMQNQEKDPLQNFSRACCATDGRQIGRTFVSYTEISKGSNGVVVFEGEYNGRSVAVKRLLHVYNDIAVTEIQSLGVSDNHANIIRLYGAEQDSEFFYISLELCTCNLDQLIHQCSGPSSVVVNNQSSESNLESLKGIPEDLELWRDNGWPSTQLLQIIRDIVCGVAHLHKLGIVHRNLNPQNVLINFDESFCAKLSDMGLSKCLLKGTSSMNPPATGYGSPRWQAPEQLRRSLETHAVDLFNVGCLIFFCLTKGKHPFGSCLEPDLIIKENADLFLVDMPEAVDLLSRLLDANPNMRMSAQEILSHPFFWNCQLRISFIRDTSDRLEGEDGSQLLIDIESISFTAFGKKWKYKLDADFISDLGNYRKYKYNCVRDLLRVIRNKSNHYRDLPKNLQELVGPIPEGFDRYFSSRFQKYTKSY